MPLPANVRIELYKMLGTLRPLWDDAGINDATKTLAAMPEDPFTLLRRAITAAGIASNQKPICITWTEGPHMHPDTPNTRPKEIPPCPSHGGIATRGPGGAYACCWQEDQERQAGRTHPETETNP